MTVTNLFGRNPGGPVVPRIVMQHALQTMLGNTTNPEVTAQAVPLLVEAMRGVLEVHQVEVRDGKPRCVHCSGLAQHPVESPCPTVLAMGVTAP